MQKVLGSEEALWTAEGSVKVGMVSLGCPKNRVDSERMLGQLRRAGYAITPHAEQADLLLVNTCAFVRSAQEESIESILKMARHKEKGRCKALVVTGCLPERALARSWRIRCQKWTPGWGWGHPTAS